MDATPQHDHVLPPDALAARLAEIYAVVGPLYRRAFRVVEENTPVEGMSVGLRAVLERLCHTRTETVPQIGRALALSRQFVQRMVNDALAQGYVVSRPNPAHRRSSLIEITAEGEAAIAAITAHEHTALRRVGGDITAGEAEATLRVLHQMLRALDDVRFEDAEGPGEANR